MTRLHERGMVTAEYTVGTVAAVTIALVLFKVNSIVGADNALFDFIKGALDRIISDVFSGTLKWVPRLWL